jgi:hypothetical protein
VTEANSFPHPDARGTIYRPARAWRKGGSVFRACHIYAGGYAMVNTRVNVAVCMILVFPSALGMTQENLRGDRTEVFSPSLPFRGLAP